MQQRNGWQWAATWIFGLLMVASPAAALTLGDLVGGADFSSLDGTLTFSDFEASSVSGDLNPDLDAYQILALEDGFRITGPMGVADGNSGLLTLVYKVSSDPMMISASSAFFNGAAYGEEAIAEVDSTLNSDSQAGPMVTELELIVLGDGTKVKVDSAGFAPMNEIYVTEEIRVDSEGAFGATISAVEQRFSVVPEPSSTLLFAVGASAITYAGRRRRA